MVKDIDFAFQRSHYNFPLLDIIEIYSLASSKVKSGERACGSHTITEEFYNAQKKYVLTLLADETQLLFPLPQCIWELRTFLQQ